MRRQNTPAVPTAGVRDVVRASRFSATWTCSSGAVGTAYFNRVITIGHCVGGGRLRSKVCGLEWRPGRIVAA